MTLIIMLVVAVVVFALLWYGVGLLPVPAGLPWLRNVLYLLLILVAAYWLWTRFVH